MAENNNIIHSELIFLDEDLHEKSDIIRRIAEKAQEIGYISDAQAFYQAVIKREEEVPTAIGYHIAIPHGKTNVVKNPFIAFFRSKEMFKWTEGFDEEAQLIFQIGIPEEGTERLHLKFISQVSKKLLDKEFRNKLLMTKNKNDVYQLLNAIDI